LIGSVGWGLDSGGVLGEAHGAENGDGSGFVWLLILANG
jgi:hypothetical protein